MPTINPPVLSVMDDLALNVDANAYVDEAYFVAYHSNLQNDLSLYTDDQVTAAIIRGSRYLDQRFMYVGYRLVPYQRMEWPRQNAWDNRRNIVLGLPPQVQEATCEYALRSLQSAAGSGGMLVADPSRDETGKDLQRRIDTISGAVKSEAVFDRYTGFRMPSYPEADLILTARGLVYKSNFGSLSVGTIGRS